MMLAAVVCAAVLLGGCTGMMPGGAPMGSGAMSEDMHEGMQGNMPGGMHGEDAAQAPEPEPGKLTVVDVRARPAPLEGGNGAAYLTVLNGLETPVRLLSAAGEAAAAVELHETIDDNGVMKMEPHPEGFEIPAGGVLELKPGGKHVMLLGLVKPLAVGDSLDLTLNFEGSDAITLTVPVVDMQMAMPAMEQP
jgi:copper(I)-binding protein